MIRRLPATFPIKNGGGGNRTRVQKWRSKSHYILSLMSISHFRFHKASTGRASSVSSSPPTPERSCRIIPSTDAHPLPLGQKQRGRDRVHHAAKAYAVLPVVVLPACLASLRELGMRLLPLLSLSNPFAPSTYIGYRKLQALSRLRWKPGLRATEKCFPFYTQSLLRTRSPEPERCQSYPSRYSLKCYTDTSLKSVNQT